MGQKESKDRLSKQDLDFLKTSTRFDEDTIIEWYRGFKSDCPDGKLTPKAFMQIYSKCSSLSNYDTNILERNLSKRFAHWKNQSDLEIVYSIK